MSNNKGELKLDDILIVVLGLFVIFLIIKLLSALTILVPLGLVLLYTSPRTGLIVSGAIAFLGIIAMSLIPDLWFVKGTQDSISFASKMALGGVVNCAASFWAMKNPTKWETARKKTTEAIDRILRKIGFISEEDKQ